MSINNSAPKNTNSKITAARQPTEDVNNQESTKRYVNEEVIVKFRTPEAIATTDTLATTKLAMDVAKTSLMAELNATVVEDTNVLGIERWQLNGMSADDAIAQSSKNPLVEFIEPNYIVTKADIFPNDPSYEQLWGLNNTGQTGGTLDADIDAPEAGDIRTGSPSVVIGVIDTGVDYAHPDLNDNMWINPGEIAGNGIDDDNNGFIDDIHGYDFVNNDGDPLDDDGHGTHVAGTIAAEGNNGVGVAGVTWSAQIMALKFLDEFGSGTTFDAIQAIDYAVLMGADLTNNSWGGGGFSQALQDAIANAGAAGQVFVASAGNSGLDTDSSPSYPAAYDLDNIISVAATNASDQLAGFSNFGANSVDLAAPGVDVFSTFPGTNYGFLSGTSMASPHVTGVAALLLAENPNLTPAELKGRLLETVDPIPALDGATVSGGRLNAFNALFAPDAARIQGSKWHDLDADGLRDASEPGLAGWTIYLDANNNGALDAGERLTITGPEGNYSFSFLEPDTYTVAEVSQPGWEQTSPDGVQTVPLAEGETVDGVDFGNFLANPASITGSKWNDLDDSGIRDAGEPGLADWTIYLDRNQNGALDEDEPFTVTNTNGDYAFTGLVPDAYTVGEVLQPGWRQTSPSAVNLAGNLFTEANDTLANALLIDLVAGAPGIFTGAGSIGDNANVASVNDVDLMAVELAAGDRLTIDIDSAEFGSGLDPILRVFDAVGDQVSVSDDNPAPGEPSTLDAYIDYTAATAGTYYIGISSYANFGYDPTVGGSGSGGSTGSYDIELLLNGGEQAGVQIVAVGPGEDAADIDFGNFELPPGNITGRKWNDINGNGQPDASEPGLADWTVYIDQNQNGQLDDGELSTLTGANGGYSFEDLPVATYAIAEVLQPTWRQTFPGLANSFETGDFTGWETLGETQIETAEFGAEPTDGVFQALMSSGGSTVSDTELEAFLELEAGSLDALSTGDVTEGSAIKQVLTVSAGTELSFDWSFLTNEGPFTGFNDFGFVTITPITLEAVADTTSVLIPSSTSFNLETGFEKFAYTFAAGGTFTIGVGVADVNDGAVASGLLVDNFSFAGNSTPIATSQRVAVGEGETVSNVDFGNWQPVTLAGTKWRDLNGNGVRDGNDPGLADWTLYVDTNENGTLDEGEPFAVTDAEGDYSFTVQAGTYTVTEIPQPGWVQTAPDSGSYTVSLEPGENTENLDFGSEALPVSITGQKWNDADADGVFDPDETGLPGWTIYLDQNANGVFDDDELSTVTSANGAYTFTDLEFGTYNVAEVPQTTWEQTFPSLIGDLLDEANDTIADAIVVGSPASFGDEGFIGDNLEVTSTADVDMIELSLAAGDRITIDIDAAEFSSDLDPVLRLFDEAGNEIRVSDDDPAPGEDFTLDAYIDFTATSAETYYVGVSSYANFSYDPTVPGSGDGGSTGEYSIAIILNDSELAASNEDIELAANVVTLGPGEAATDINFGNWQPVTLAGTKWRDLDGDGNQDANEPGLADWTIYLDANQNGGLDEGELSTTTDEAGGYSFTVQTGTYTVAEVPQVGWVQTLPEEGSYTVNLAPGEDATELNFGNQDLPISISGRKWHDLDDDGEFDPDEPGLAGWTIYLDQNNSGALDEDEQSTVTDADGTYAFTDLPFGSYFVAEVLQDGWRQTAPGVDVTGNLLGEGNDTFANALVIGSPSSFTGEGVIGDNPNVAATNDVDLLKVQLGAGDRITIDIDSAEFSSGLDPILRLFDEAGNEVSVSDDVPAPGEPSTLDPYIDFTPSTDGIYYVGISSFANFSYDPTVPGSGDGGSTGEYAIAILIENETQAGVNTVNLGPGESASDVNFGNIQLLPSSIAGRKWNDLNGDGTQDADEPGLADWTIYLDQNQNGQLDEGEASALTNASGLYAFEDILPGTYTVAEVLQDGWQQTFPGLVGGFETGDFANWVTLGDTRIETADFGVGPTEGAFQALLTTDSPAAADSELEDFLGLEPGSLDAISTDDATEGSAIKQTITVAAGTELSFDWNYFTNEGAGAFFNDFGFVTITPVALDTLADTNSMLTLSNTEFGLETGFETFTYTFETAGTFVIGVGVMDVNDGVVGSGLLVDNFVFAGNATSVATPQTVVIEEDETATGVNFGNQRTAVEPILGTPNDDVLTITDGGVSVSAGNAQDIIDASQSPGGNQLFGGDGDDRLIGNTNDQLFGENGNDRLDVTDGGGNNLLDGGAGDDTLSASDGDDTLEGGNGNDRATGGLGADLIFGSQGDDVLQGEADADLGGGNDTIYGGANNDRISGRGGNDQLFGDGGDDQIQGGAGDDILRGGLGNDRLTGNAGADVFVLAADEGIDTIVDFAIGVDLIGLADGLTFADLTFSESRILVGSQPLVSLNVASVNLNETSFIVL